MLFSVMIILLFDMIKNLEKRSIIAFLSGIIIVILPWIIRNTFVMGSPIIASNTGINLFIGHNPEANGSYKYVDAMNRFDGMSETQANTIALQSAMQNIAHDPLHSILLIPKKIAFLFASDSYLPLQSLQIEGNSYRERMQNLPWWTYLLIIPGSLLIFFGVSHGKALLSLSLGNHIIAIIIGMIIPCAIFFGTPRYHEPMIPFLVIAIIIGYAQKRNLLGSLTVFALPLIVIWFIEYFMIFFQ
jgi:hypothetical protein